MADSPDPSGPAAFSSRPPPWASGAPSIWDDPHIGAQLLATHLDPTNDLASRRPDVIETSVAWLVGHLGLGPGVTLLDLGCGPGLYACRLARAGVAVTGLDRAERCLVYAREQASAEGLPIEYVRGDFTRLDYDARFDVVTQIYGELSVQRPDVRDDVLRRVHRALRPRGRLVFDVSTPRHHRRRLAEPRAHESEGGFWRPGPHRVHERRIAYPDDVFLDEFVVVAPDGRPTVHRIWFQAHTAERITAALEAASFAVESLWSDLAGTPLTDDAEWIGVVARRH